MAENTSIKLRNQLIYQVFTRNYKEGTFCAVEADLDRIRQLGVDIIYLLPIQPNGEMHKKGSMGSPYAIRDYRAIDPRQGSMEEFVHLCDAVHKKGMKIMIDVVYNHTSPDSVLYQSHPEWFYRREDGQPGNRVGEWWDVIDLDYSVPGLWDYQIDTLKMWAAYVDGFRCDVAPMVPLDFWKRAREEVEAVRPGCIWLAESANPEFILYLRMQGIPASSDGEEFQVFDICYDYDVYADMLGAMKGERSLTSYIDKVQLQECSYPDSYVKLRCLENHDRERAAALVPDERRLRNWTAWNYFSKGIVMIYAGEENCAAHLPSLFEPDRVFFDPGKDITDFLVRLREIKRDPLFAEGILEVRTAAEDKSVILASYTAKKSGADPLRKMIGAFSTGESCAVPCPELADGEYENLITESPVIVRDGVLVTDGEPVIIKITGD